LDSDLGVNFEGRVRAEANSAIPPLFLVRNVFNLPFTMGKHEHTELMKRRTNLRLKHMFFIDYEIT
jgi:hypothetical protein